MTSLDLEDAKALLTQLQGFRETLHQEWITSVSNQWGNLKLVWHDELFDQFEPPFEQLDDSYREAEKDCEEYITFIKEQIQIAEEVRGSISGL